MEEIKAPKKERKFLKAMGDIALTLFRELLLGVGKKVINKVGNKQQGLVIAFALVAGISYASIDSIPYPVTGNKQRLGWQTTGNGLVWRGTAADTVTKPTSYADKNVKAYLILDSVSGSLYVFKQGAWAAITGAGGGLTMPFDSITFNTAKDGTVGVGEVEYNDTQGSLIQGLKGGNVTNVIGQQLHQRVNNRTGSTLSKGTAVYLSGSQGNRITVAKALGVTDAFSANTFGIVAESIANNQSGYVITEGLITDINTSSLVEDSAVYLSPTVAGGLTSTKPQAPQHTVYIGVCVKSNAGSGELFVKIRNGQELDELHDVRITSPVDKASLYYKSSEGLWRDTTAALLVSDTASMLSNYALKSYADTSGRFYARQDFENVQSSTLTWTQSDTLVPGGVSVIQVYRNGQILLPTQYTVPTKTTVVIAATSYKVGENYSVIFPRGGGGGGGSGSGSLTSISGGTGITVSPNPITTTGTVSADLTVLMELTDTSLLNLSTRFASKLNTTDTASLSARIDTKGSGTVTSVASGYGITGGTITTTGTLRLDSASVYNYIRDSIVEVQIGNDTIKILKQEYNNATSDTLVWTTTVKFPIQLRAYILLFRNGQLLINDQFTVIDTNKIKIAATSYKLGENYTLVTVSGIGSAGVSQTGNPVYPEAGIALSTGTTWTTSITNNSSNWNTAYSDRLKWDGGNTGLVAATGRTSLGGTTIGQSMFTLTNPSAITFPRFNDDNTITARSAANFRSDIGAGSVTTVTVAAGTPLSIQNNTTTPEISMAAASGSVNGYLSSTDWTTFNGKQNALGNASASVSGILTSTDWSTFNGKQNTLTNPVTGTGTNDFIPKFTSTGSTIGNSVIQESSGNIGIGTTPIANLTFDVSKNILLKSGSTGIASILFSETGTPSSTDVEFGGILRYNGSLDRMELVTRDNLGGSNVTNTGITMDRITGNIGLLKPTTISSTLAVTGNITEGGNNVLTNLDTASLSSRIDLKLNKTDTASLSTRIDLKLNKTDTASLSNRINGKVSLTGDEYINGQKTFGGLIIPSNGMQLTATGNNSNKLIGINTSSFVGEVTLGTGLTLTSNVLNATERYYFDLGIVAGAADNSASTYDFTYSSNIFIVPTSLNGYCIDSVYIRAIGCSTCPPVAGDKDYYVGVYKANAGSRVATSGATLVGSQITMNEYDLNEVNRNDTLLTGEAWWVYLNGTYTSDLAYVTAGFIVKKTCN
jgi:hypothetical protein